MRVESYELYAPKTVGRDLYKSFKADRNNVHKIAIAIKLRKLDLQIFSSIKWLKLTTKKGASQLKNNE